MSASQIVLDIHDSRHLCLFGGELSLAFGIQHQFAAAHLYEEAAPDNVFCTAPQKPRSISVRVARIRVLGVRVVVRCREVVLLPCLFEHLSARHRMSQ